jgi:hypothetical protein
MEIIREGHIDAGKYPVDLTHESRVAALRACASARPWLETRVSQCSGMSPEAERTAVHCAGRPLV